MHFHRSIEATDQTDVRSRESRMKRKFKGREAGRFEKQRDGLVAHAHKCHSKTNERPASVEWL